MTVKEICAIIDWHVIVFVKRKGERTIVADAYDFYKGTESIHREVQKITVYRIKALNTGSIELYA